MIEHSKPLNLPVINEILKLIGLFRMKIRSPYLDNPSRLTDVIAALQVLGSYKFYKLSSEGWSERITGDAAKSDYWHAIFSDHPEFFRFDQNRIRVSLVWRRHSAKRFHVDKDTTLSEADMKNLSDKDLERVSREPLDSTDIKTLMDTAISLHARAIEQRRESKWWVPLASALGALFGALIGAVAKTTI